MSDESQSTADRTPAPSAVDELGVTRTQAPAAPHGGVPDWAPWGVLGGLLALGLLGGLGVIPTERLRASSAKPSAPVAGAASAVSSASPAASSGAEQKISVQHLVVSYQGTLLGQHVKTTRTKEEARQRAQQAYERARKGEDFTKLVLEYSDEPRILETKGVLGNFRRRDAIPAFSAASFALKPGELSQPAESPFGFHVILRTK